MTLIDQLLTVSHAYCAARRLSESRLSTLMLNDGKRLGAIGAGGDLRTAIFERSMCWLSEHWPDGATWPPSVPRPALPPHKEPQATSCGNANSLEPLP